MEEEDGGVREGRLGEICERGVTEKREKGRTGGKWIWRDERTEEENR